MLKVCVGDAYANTAGLTPSAISSYLRAAASDISTLLVRRIESVGTMRFKVEKHYVPYAHRSETGVKTGPCVYEGACVPQRVNVKVNFSVKYTVYV